jgi:phosphate/sulfate permease
MGKWIGFCQLVLALPWGIAYFIGMSFLVRPEQYGKVVILALITAPVIGFVCSMFLWPIVGRGYAMKRKWITPRHRT